MKKINPLTKEYIFNSLDFNMIADKDTHQHKGRKCCTQQELFLVLLLEFIISTLLLSLKFHFTFGRRH